MRIELFLNFSVFYIFLWIVCYYVYKESVQGYIGIQVKVLFFVYMGLFDFSVGCVYVMNSKLQFMLYGIILGCCLGKFQDEMGVVGFIKVVFWCYYVFLYCFMERCERFDNEDMNSDVRRYYLVYNLCFINICVINSRVFQ